MKILIKNEMKNNKTLHHAENNASYVHVCDGE